MIFLNKILHDPSLSLQTNANTPTRGFLERLPRLLWLPSITEKNSASKPIICRRVVCVSAGVDTRGGRGWRVVEGGEWRELEEEVEGPGGVWTEVPAMDDRMVKISY